LFGIGGGGNVDLNYPLPWLTSFSLQGGLGYNYMPVQAEIALSEISLGGGLGYEIELIPFISLFAGASAGYYVGVLPMKTGNMNLGTGLMIEGGGGVSFNLSLA
jgi:hypothetical protein